MPMPMLSTWVGPGQHLRRHVFSDVLPDALQLAAFAAVIMKDDQVGVLRIEVLPRRFLQLGSLIAADRQLLDFDSRVGIFSVQIFEDFLIDGAVGDDRLAVKQNEDRRVVPGRGRLEQRQGCAGRNLPKSASSTFTGGCLGPPSRLMPTGREAVVAKDEAIESEKRVERKGRFGHELDVDAVRAGRQSDVAEIDPGGVARVGGLGC